MKVQSNSSPEWQQVQLEDPVNGAHTYIFFSVEYTHRFNIYSTPTDAFHIALKRFSSSSFPTATKTHSITARFQTAANTQTFHISNYIFMEIFMLPGGYFNELGISSFFSRKIKHILNAQAVPLYFDCLKCFSVSQQSSDLLFIFINLSSFKGFSPRVTVCLILKECTSYL